MHLVLHDMSNNRKKKKKKKLEFTLVFIYIEDESAQVIFDPIFVPVSNATSVVP